MPALKGKRNPLAQIVWREILSPFLSLYSTRICPLCHREHQLGLLCLSCLRRLRSFRLRLPIEPEALKPPSPVTSSWACLRYEGPVRELVLGYKFHRRYPLLRLLSWIFNQKLRELLPKLRIGLLVPISTPALRRLLRTTDMPSDLARHASRSLKIPFQACLSRPLLPPRQLGKPRKERLALGKEAFRLRTPPKSPRLLLIDDVLTTGATVKAAAEVLRQAGAKEIHVLTLAYADPATSP